MLRPVDRLSEVVDFHISTGGKSLVVSRMPHNRCDWRDDGVGSIPCCIEAYYIYRSSFGQIGKPIRTDMDKAIGRHVAISEDSKLILAIGDSADEILRVYEYDNYKYNWKPIPTIVKPIMGFEEPTKKTLLLSHSSNLDTIQTLSEVPPHDLYCSSLVHIEKDLKGSLEAQSRDLNIEKEVISGDANKSFFAGNTGEVEITKINYKRRNYDRVRFAVNLGMDFEDLQVSHDGRTVIALNNGELTGFRFPMWFEKSMSLGLKPYKLHYNKPIPVTPSLISLTNCGKYLAIVVKDTEEEHLLVYSIHTRRKQALELITRTSYASDSITKIQIEATKDRILLGVLHENNKPDNDRNWFVIKYLDI